MIQNITTKWMSDLQMLQTADNISHVGLLLQMRFYILL